MTEHTGKFVAYYRVSTNRQGRSGLGLEAQRKAVADYLNGGPWKIVAERVEVETGKRNDRPRLQEALDACRVHRATLVIAKLDRLGRNAAFLLGLQEAGVEFVCCDDPHMTPLTLGIRAVVAQHEAEMISTRTKDALAAAKARGRKLGGFRGSMPTAEAWAASAASKRATASKRAADLAETIRNLQAAGATSLRKIADGLNEAGIPTATGTGIWSAVQVQRVLARLG
jgi:DNA invertase Pin-like site-specific DNA recombinase